MEVTNWVTVVFNITRPGPATLATWKQSQALDTADSRVIPALIQRSALVVFFLMIISLSTPYQHPGIGFGI